MDWLWEVLNIGGLEEWATTVLQTDIAKMTIAFTIAAHLHRRWVKKDVAEQFTKIEAAINNVGATLSKDLAAHTARLSNVEEVVTELKSGLPRIDKIEQVVSSLSARVFNLETPHPLKPLNLELKTES